MEIDKRKLLNKLGELPKETQNLLKENIRIVLDIE